MLLLFSRRHLERARASLDSNPWPNFSRRTSYNLQMSFLQVVVLGRLRRKKRGKTKPALCRCWAAIITVGLNLLDVLEFTVAHFLHPVGVPSGGVCFTCVSLRRFRSGCHPGRAGARCGCSPVSCGGWTTGAPADFSRLKDLSMSSVQTTKTIAGLPGDASTPCLLFAASTVPSPTPNPFSVNSAWSGVPSFGCEMSL